MPMLFVNCHGCHHPFPSGIAHAEADAGKVQMLGVIERCPKCKDESRYDTHEFFFPQGVRDADDQAVAPTTPPETEPPGDSEGIGNRDRSPTIGPE